MHRLELYETKAGESAAVVYVGDHTEAIDVINLPGHKAFKGTSVFTGIPQKYLMYQTKTGYTFIPSMLENFPISAVVISKNCTDVEDKRLISLCNTGIDAGLCAEFTQLLLQCIDGFQFLQWYKDRLFWAKEAGADEYKQELRNLIGI